MGACCSSPRKADTDTDRTPVYYYCPRTLEEREPLSLNQVTSSAVSPGLLLDRNSEVPVSDAHAYPAPVPSGVGFSCSHTQPGNYININTKSCHILIGSPIVGERTDEDRSGLKGSHCKRSVVVGEQDAPELVKDELLSKLSVSNDPTAEEEDVCPTCLEEYDLENPRIITKCEHHFHLSCILEWKERSNTCPICDKVMEFDMDS